MTQIAGSGSRIRIRIHKSKAWIRGSGSTPKCGSATLKILNKVNEPETDPNKPSRINIIAVLTAINKAFFLYLIIAKLNSVLALPG